MTGILCAFVGGGAQPAVTGQQAYTTPGTYSWVAPTGVFAVSVVAVGGGAGSWGGAVSGGGGGGGLGYKNNYVVTPGNSYTVFIAAKPAYNVNAGDSYFVSTGVVKGGGGQARDNGQTAGGAGGTYTGDGGGNGGNGGTNGGGGGAGGYSGAGGTGGANGSDGLSGSGGGGGGSYGSAYVGGGGGVGILGQGSNGAGGTVSTGGGGGSGGQTGYGSSKGGLYGGGSFAEDGWGTGAVRIIWPGTNRQFPSTGTGDL